MTRMRFNHMELTVPPGHLTPEFRADAARFYGTGFGWEVKDTPIVGQMGLLLMPDDGQFVLVTEHPEHMNRPRYDHLGLLLDTRAEVDDALAFCQDFQRHDDRVEIKLYDDLVGPTVIVHAFYVRYLLPIHFDVQNHESPVGALPNAYRWSYA